MDDLAPALCANLFCLGAYAAFAGGTWGLAHRRMKRIEAEDGPADVLEESRWFAYAGASALWVIALGAAVYFFFRRDAARRARDCLALLWAHLGLATLISGTASATQALRVSPAVPVMVGATLMISVAALGMLAFAWRGGTARRTRIEALPATGPEMGPERYAYYVGAAVAWFVGPVAAWMLREPQNVAVGVRAMRISLVQLALLLCTTSFALLVFVAVMAP